MKAIKSAVNRAMAIKTARTFAGLTGTDPSPTFDLELLDTSDSWHIVVIGDLNVEVDSVDGVARFITDVDADPRSLLGALRSLNVELTHRLASLEAEGVDHVSQLKYPLTTVLIIAEEATLEVSSDTIKAEYQDEVRKLIGNITRQGKAAGMYVSAIIKEVSNPDTKSVGPDLRLRLPRLSH